MIEGLNPTPISAHPRENRAWTGPGWDDLGCGGIPREGVGGKDRVIW